MAIIIVMSLFSIYFINPVSAQEETPQENLACCERTISGEACRYTQTSNCDVNYKVGEFQTCEDSTFCKPGCCISPNGDCSKQVSKGTCDALEGYTFDADATCNIAKCNKGCCVLGGSSCLYSTEKKCGSVLQEYPEIAKDYRPIGSEQECTNVCRAADKGCCVRDDGTCKYEARGICTLPDGTGSTGFYNEVFCANAALEQSCECTPHAYKSCVEGSEDVYYFDSCGNQEDVATDCDYGAGDLCSAPDANSDEAYCKSVNCDAANNAQPKQNVNVKDNEILIDDYSANDRRNGESWCLYDGKVGATYDLVGSRYFRSLCLNGESIIEPCKDFREEICAQGDVDTNQGLYRESSCFVNKYSECTTLCNSNKETDPSSPDFELKVKTDRSCCENPLRSCAWVNTKPDNSTGICIPGIKPGGKFWPEENAASTQGTELGQKCGIASRTCEAAWIIPTIGDEYCEKNCECYDNGYLEFVNTYCKGLGDCGAHYNYVGSYDNNGLYRSWTGTPIKPGGKDPLKTLEDPNKFNNGQDDDLAVSGDGLFAGRFNLEDLYKKSESPNIGIGLAGAAGYGALGVGAGLGIAAAAGVGLTTGGILAGGGTVSLMATTAGGAAAGAALGTVAGIAAIAAALIIGVYGLAKGDRTAVFMAGALAGATALIAVAASALPAVALTTATGLTMTGYGAIIAAVIAITFITLSLLESSETRTVQLTCSPWQPPLGGDDCELCDKDDLKQCSEYRCRSLGATCKFIKENEGTRKGTCYNADPNDVNRPIIQRWDETFNVISKRQDIADRFQIRDFEEGGLEGGYEIMGEIPSFSRINFGIQTNELSQCRMGDELKNTYNELTLPFPDTYFSNWHNISIGPLLPGKTYEYYVICRDPSGNPKEEGRTAPFKIRFKTDNGPDLEPPLIIATSVPNNGKIMADANALLLGLYVDESSQFSCKYSNQDKDYTLMESNTTCAAAPAESILSSYALCADNLTIVGEEPNVFYFRCADRPVNAQGQAQEPNINGGSYIYTVTKSKPLKITQASPQGQTLYSKEATMQAKTAEGSESGLATCYYEGSGYTSEFFKTNQTDGIHEQKFLGLPRGFYNFAVTCYDSVRNEAKDNINFTIDVDEVAPVITGLYNSGSSTIINFNEPATCEYANQTFIFGQGIKAGTLQLQQTLSGLQSYHVICEDSFNNRILETVIIPPGQVKAV